MNDKGEPDYIHFARIRMINLTEAVWLLASFDLCSKNISDPDEYDKLLNEKKKLAYRVLRDAEYSGVIKLKYVGEPADVDMDGEYYDSYNIMLNTLEFLTWAFTLNYDLPEILLKLIRNEESKKCTHLNKISLDKDAPVTPGHKRGKPKGFLSEAVEHVYEKLHEHGKSDLAKPSKIREFIIFMKEMATKTSRYADEEIMAMIKAIQVPEEGVCTITTADNVILRGQRETIIRGREYTNNDIAKILTRLRKNNI